MTFYDETKTLLTPLDAVAIVKKLPFLMTPSRCNVGAEVVHDFLNEFTWWTVLQLDGLTPRELGTISHSLGLINYTANPELMRLIAVKL